MSHFAIQWALAQTILRPSEKLILISLADKHNSERGCFPSRTKIAQETNLPLSSVKRHLRALEGAGLIRPDGPSAAGPRSAVVRYFFNFEEGFGGPDQ